MTTENLRKLESFLYRYDKTGRKGRGMGDAVVLSLLRNMISSCLSNSYVESLKLVGTPFLGPCKHLVSLLVKNNGVENDLRTFRIDEIGRVIGQPASKLPLMIGQYDHNPIASAILEWRIRERI